tara:strand:- start:734 stop:2803 length:2070 start_codon:yes stop_codon:yes gene_type:complete
MTEFTRDIKPINYKAAPQFEAPSGSLGTDIVNVAATGFEIYSQYKNKQKEANVNNMLQSLGDMEVELYSNGLGERDVLRKLDSRIKELSQDADSQTYLRARLTQQRGASVRNQIVQQEQNEDLQREQGIEKDFQVAISNMPDFYGTLKRNPDGTVDESEKINIIEKFGERQVRLKEAQRLTAMGQAKLAEGEAEASQGALEISSSIGTRVDESFVNLANNYITTVDNMDVQSTDTASILQETSANFRNMMGVVSQQVESEFNSAFMATTDETARKILKENKEATLLQIEKIKTNLSSDDIDVAKKLAAQAALIQNGLKLSGLKNFGLTAMFEEVASGSGRFVTEALINKRPELFTAVEQQTAMGLGNLLSQDQTTMQFGKDVLNYMDTGDTSKASDLVLATFYDATKKILNSGVVKDLSAAELEKVSGGLIGILAEAAATDDPAQIKEATKLLNSDNFNSFFDQLPEERKSSLGRFVSSYNQDILIDRTDGILKKLEGYKDIADIEYDAVAGEFKIGRVIPERSTSGLGVGFTKQYQLKKVIQDANTSINQIKNMSQYDPTTQDGKVLVDSALDRYLPENIKVTGELTPYVAEKREGLNGSSAKKIENKAVLKQYQDQIAELQKIIATGGGFAQTAVNPSVESFTNEKQDYNLMASEQGVDLSSYEDGEYENGNGQTVVIKNGQVVSVK